MAAGGFTKKSVDIEALMAQAAAMEAEEKAKAEAAASGGKKKKEKKEKKEKPVKPKKEKEKKVKPLKEKKEKDKKKKAKAKKGEDEEELIPREVFGVPLTTLNIPEGDTPEVFTDLITVLEGHGTSTYHPTVASSPLLEQPLKRRVCSVRQPVSLK